MARIRPNFNLCTSMIACDGADIPPHIKICTACKEKEIQRKQRDAREAKANKTINAIREK